jgi:small subunit ribosomal protein S9
MADTKSSDIKLPETKTPAHLGTGRRKTAVARVRLASGTGKITVNGRLFEDYFPMESQRMVVTQPLTVTNLVEKFDAAITVTGGGPNGQATAVRHGLARALLKFDANLRPSLKAEGFLTRDPRMRERKKYGQPGARKRFQFSKR